MGMDWRCSTCGAGAPVRVDVNLTLVAVMTCMRRSLWEPAGVRGSGSGSLWLGVVRVVMRGCAGRHACAPGSWLRRTVEASAASAAQGRRTSATDNHSLASACMSCV